MATVSPVQEARWPALLREMSVKDNPLYSKCQEVRDFFGISWKLSRCHYPLNIAGKLDGDFTQSVPEHVIHYFASKS
jgi:hypothetical protein